MVIRFEADTWIQKILLTGWILLSCVSIGPTLAKQLPRLSLSLSLLESKQVVGYLRLLPLASLARFITDALPDANSTGPQSHATI